jgi:hypothetical protein
MAGANNQQQGFREVIRENIPPTMLSFVAGGGASAAVDHFVNEAAVNFKDVGIVGGEAALLYIAGRILSATNVFNRFPVATRVGGITGLITAAVSTGMGMENPLIIPVSVGASVLTGAVGEVIHRNRHEIRAGIDDMVERNRQASEERKARKVQIPQREEPRRTPKVKSQPVRPSITLSTAKPEKKHLNLLERECLEFGDFFLGNMATDRLIQDFSEQLERTPRAPLDRLSAALVDTEAEQQIWNGGIAARVAELQQNNPKWSLTDIFNELGWQTIDQFQRFYDDKRDMAPDGYPVSIRPVNQEMKKRRLAAIKQNSSLSEEDAKILIGSESIQVLDRMALAIRRITEKYDRIIEGSELSTAEINALEQDETNEILEMKGRSLATLRQMYARA